MWDPSIYDKDDYDAYDDNNYSNSSDSTKDTVNAENEKAVDFYNEGMRYWQNGHPDDARTCFKCALYWAHDSNLKRDCEEMIRNCTEKLAEIYNR